MKTKGLFFKCVVVFSFLILAISFNPVQASANECTATFDFVTNTLHIPCFDLNNTSYWLDLSLTTAECVPSGTVLLKLKDFGVPAFSQSDLVGSWGGCWYSNFEGLEGPNCGTGTIMSSGTFTVNCSVLSGQSITISPTGTVTFSLFHTIEHETFTLRGTMNSNKTQFDIYELEVYSVSYAASGTFTKGQYVPCN